MNQTGIATPSQRHLVLAAFDFQREDLDSLRELLVAWSAAADALMRGASSLGPTAVDDSGETAGLGPAGLSVTFGLGPSLFDRHGRLGAVRPSTLAPLPAFPNDALAPPFLDGDLCVQACADDRQVAFHAVHTLTRLASGAATPRWTQAGFLPATAGTPRNLMGFKDGTASIRPGDRGALDEHVWVGREDDAGWMRGGTYMVVRRVRVLLDVWDATSVASQEAAVGRRKASGAPLGAAREHDPLDLDAERDGAPLIPAGAHVRVAAPRGNGGARLLRRSYNYADGVDAATGQLDAGLIFVCFQRDPARQFVRIQRQLAQHDALRKHLLHTGSALFACPPGARPGSFVGEPLIAAA